MTTVKVIIHQGDKTLDTLGWIRWAETDYLGARILPLTDLLVQGSALANTAIEKFLKALFLHSGVPAPHGHNAERFYRDLKTQVPGCGLDLNVEFLKLINKAYLLRYPDDLEEGLNIVFNQAKLLSQLDRSVLEIGRHLNIKLRGQTQRMVLDRAREKDEPRYFDRNVAVEPSRASLLFSGRSECYELRIHRQMIIEAFYKVEGVSDDLVFNQAGMEIEPQNPQQYRMAYTPIE
jgi:HEPN domain-containing protein